MLFPLKEAGELLSDSLRRAERGRLFSRQQANTLAESLLPLAERHGWSVSVDTGFPFRARLTLSERAWVTVSPNYGRAGFEVTVGGLTTNAGRDVPMQAVPLYAEALALSVVWGLEERSAA